MGNTFSYKSQEEHNTNNSNASENVIQNKNTTLIDYIDMLATNYILKQNMIDMVRFSDKEYYDDLIVLTASIMNKELNVVDIGIMKDRVLNGNNINSNITNSMMNNNSENKLIVSSGKKLKEITLKNEKSKHKALLLISKFYIKIMTIFSAITSVIDPQYVYEDENGVKKYFYLKDFNDHKMINSNTNKIQINQLMNPFGLVKKRLAILKNKLNNEGNNENQGNYVTINPGEVFCKIGENDDNTSLNKEIGIKELDNLYYDVFDYESNKWNKRSDTMDKKYKKDLLKFYRIFTGKKSMPNHIKSFADIETLKFHKLTRCKNQDYFKDLLVSRNDKLFEQYMMKIDEIQSISKVYKQKLLSILKTIFIETEENNETNFTINPELTIETLINLQEQTKTNIVAIYTNCEKCFIEALIIYENMYENQYGTLVKSIQKNNNYSTSVNEFVSLDTNTYNSVNKQNNNEKQNSIIPPSPITPLPLTPITPLPSTPITSTPSIPITPLPSTPITPLPSTPITPLPSTPITPLPSTPITSTPSTPITPLPTTPITPLPTTPTTPTTPTNTLQQNTPLNEQTVQLEENSISNINSTVPVISNDNSLQNDNTDENKKDEDKQETSSFFNLFSSSKKEEPILNVNSKETNDESFPLNNIQSNNSAEPLSETVVNQPINSMEQPSVNSVEPLPETVVNQPVNSMEQSSVNSVEPLSETVVNQPVNSVEPLSETVVNQPVNSVEESPNNSAEPLSETVINQSINSMEQPSVNSVEESPNNSMEQASVNSVEPLPETVVNQSVNTNTIKINNSKPNSNNKIISKGGNLEKYENIKQSLRKMFT